MIGEEHSWRLSYLVIWRQSDVDAWLLPKGSRRAAAGLTALWTSQLVWMPWKQYLDSGGFGLDSIYSAWRRAHPSPLHGLHGALLPHTALASQDTADGRCEMVRNKRKEEATGLLRRCASSSCQGLMIQLWARRAGCLYVPKGSRSNLQLLYWSPQESMGFLDQMISFHTVVIVLI